MRSVYNEVSACCILLNSWADYVRFPRFECFAKHKEELLPEIRTFLASGETYTIRYGIGLLMRLYLDADFKPEYPAMVAAVTSEEYYVNMMIAWYFATALAKQWEMCIHISKSGDYHRGMTEKTNSMKEGGKQPGSTRV